MNNKELYKETLNKISSEISRTKYLLFGDINDYYDLETLYNQQKSIRVCNNELVVAFRLYSKTNQIIDYQLGKMVLSLLDSYDNYKYFDVKESPVQFSLTINDKKCVYLFDSDISSYDNYFKNKNIDKSVVSYIVTTINNNHQTRILFETFNKLNTNIKLISFDELFKHLFNIEEYNDFICAIRDNTSIMQSFGYSAFEKVGYSDFYETSKDVVDSMLKFDYYSILSKDISDNTFDGMYYRFKDCLIQKLLFAKNDDSYSKCIISSEFLYKLNSHTNRIDNSGIVIGYIKSVELILVDIVFKLSNRNLYIKTMNGRTYELNDDNAQSIIDGLTIDSSRSFINRNWNEYNNTYNSLKLFNRYLYVFNIYRKRYFHKYILVDENEIEKIRETAFILYFILFSTFSL